MSYAGLLLLLGRPAAPGGWLNCTCMCCQYKDHSRQALTAGPWALGMPF